MTTALDLALDGAALFLPAAATVTDLRSRRIPHALTLPALAAAPIMLAASGRGTEALLAVAGALASALIPALLCATRAAGGGDLQLCAALGSLLGPFPGLLAQLTAFAIVAAYLAARQLRANPSTPPRRELPFAPALLAGATLACLLR